MSYAKPLRDRSGLAAVLVVTERDETGHATRRRTLRATSYDLQRLFTPGQREELRAGRGVTNVSTKRQRTDYDPAGLFVQDW